MLGVNVKNSECKQIITQKIDNNCEQGYEERYRTPCNHIIGATWLGLLNDKIQDFNHSSLSGGRGECFTFQKGPKTPTPE